MNFLAHLYLAGEEKELIIGNFIADSVKGNKFNEYPKRIADGIVMHRSIDFFPIPIPFTAKAFTALLLLMVNSQVLLPICSTIIF